LNEKDTSIIDKRIAEVFVKDRSWPPNNTDLLSKMSDNPHILYNMIHSRLIEWETKSSLLMRRRRLAMKFGVQYEEV
jgi:hypothetical protein